jgi:hypothetical protein
MVFLTFPRKLPEQAFHRRDAEGAENQEKKPQRRKGRKGRKAKLLSGIYPAKCMNTVSLNISISMALKLFNLDDPYGFIFFAHLR